MERVEYKTDAENYEDFLTYARTKTISAIREALHDRLAFHGWAVRALEKALDEKLTACPHLVTDNQGRCENCYEFMGPKKEADCG